MNYKLKRKYPLLGPEEKAILAAALFFGGIGLVGYSYLVDNQFTQLMRKSFVYLLIFLIVMVAYTNLKKFYYMVYVRKHIPLTYDEMLTHDIKNLREYRDFVKNFLSVKFLGTTIVLIKPYDLTHFFESIYTNFEYQTGFVNLNLQWSEFFKVTDSSLEQFNLVN